MAVSAHAYAPFDAGAGANVTEDRWRRFMAWMTGRGAAANGVLRGAANGHEVYGDASGMQVKVKTGEVWIKGHWGETTSDITLPIATADATNARKDLVVARAHFVNNVIEYDVITGTPAGSPVLPSPTQGANFWEITLGQVDVPATDTSIAANQVADGRRYVDNPDTAVHSTADLTKNNNTTLADVAGLTMPVSGGAKYTFDGFFEYSAHASAAGKFQIIVPTGTTGRVGIFDNDITSAATSSAFAAAGLGVGTKAAVPVRGWLEFPNVAAAGAKMEIKVQFAQNAAHASDAVMYTSSWLRLSRTT